MEVVGIVQDAKHQNLTENPIAFYYVPFEQSFNSLRTIHVRTAVPPESLALQIQPVIHEVVPDVPITQRDFACRSAAHAGNRHSRGRGCVPARHPQNAFASRTRPGRHWPDGGFTPRVGASRVPALRVFLAGAERLCQSV